MTPLETGRKYIQNSGMVLTETDRKLMHDAVDSFYTTGKLMGQYTPAFEKELRKYFGLRCATFVNSGSSANLLALAALELPKGSEVITCATGFPTTVNPIIQCGLIPVFVDCEWGTWNINTDKLEDALSPKTKAIMFAHALGNPANMEMIMAFANKHNLKVIEDTCDAAGAEYAGKKVGTFGDAMTLSFYPAHQITTAEGGAVLSNNPTYSLVVESFRDWGRDCWCKPGEDNTCGRRFAGEYDHKFTYSRIGYNLKSTDLHAALGLSQIKRLPEFVEKRRQNWQYLYDNLKDLDYLTLSVPQPNSNPSWFGFAVGIEDKMEFSQYLDSKGVGNRPLFAGNILRQPAYKNIEKRVVGELNNSNYVMNHVIWVGCWHGLEKEDLDTIIQRFKEYKNE